MTKALPRRRGAWIAALAALPMLAAAPGQACVGTNCMLIWSTADGGGALTVQWDFANRNVLQTFKVLCAGDDCLYTAIDPGFLAVDEAPEPGFFALAAATMVSLEMSPSTTPRR